jgi:CheY-like chemotaxis protein
MKAPCLPLRCPSENDIPLVIFAEDDDEDWLLIEEALEECANAHNPVDIQVERVKDGVALMERLNSGINPNLIMLDLRMPKKDGSEALREIRQNHKTKHLPVIVMTTSRLDTDIFRAYCDGASSYVVKPVTFELMAKALKDIHYYWTKVSNLPYREALAVPA